MTFPRRRVLAILASLPLSLTLTQAVQAADDWPQRPLTLVVPYPAGGITDVQARTLGGLLTTELGQTVVIENRAGAGGAIGTGYVAHQPADGYTLLIGTQSTHGANTALYKDLRYDPLRDFTPVHGLIQISPLLGVNPKLPYTTLAEFIEYARTNPGAIRYGSAGVGSGGHLIGEAFQRATGVQLTHVPYKGTSQVVGDLIGGHIDAAFDPPMTLLQPMQAGQVRPLAFMGAQRLGALPDVPTIAEAGLPAVQIPTWTAIYVPAQTPPERVEKLADAMARAMQTEAMRTMVASFGGELLDGVRGPALDTFVRTQFDTWSGMARDTGVTLD